MDAAAETSGDAKALPEPSRRLLVAHDAGVVVVGAGPGGFAAALQAARMGARVAAARCVEKKISAKELEWTKPYF